MTLFLLWILATLDSSFAGYREAAGRNALIDKTTYFRRALVRGALYGQVAIVLVAAAAFAMMSLTSEPGRLIADFEIIGRRMLAIYLLYAIITGIAFSLRAIRSVDIRSITSTVIFGPFTLIRPLVALAGVIWGVLGAPRPATIALGLLILILMLSLERIMTWMRTGHFRSRSRQLYGHV
jgi:hypothetical protein